jgi:4-hydroxy-3-methylbut-2-en-1-yl diphosphate synthase IspG/GcpE
MFFYQLQLIANFQKNGLSITSWNYRSWKFCSGSVKSSIGLGTLLLDGIGDTIRISLSDDPVKEIKIGNEILKSLGLRNRGVKIISCPSCARQAFQVIDTVKILEEKLSHIKTPVNVVNNWMCSEWPW